MMTSATSRDPGSAPSRPAAGDGATSGELVIAVATYHRPADISRCVTSLRAERSAFLADHPGRTVRILVVDNDPAGSARAAVEAVSGPEVAYVVEPAPGISAARNRALREAASADLLIFVDDDEEAVRGWLDHLVTAYERWRPAAVAGRVVSAFERPLDPWIEAGGFFRRRSLPTGTPVSVAATNNLLLDLRVVREAGLRFDDAYGLTGGGDSHFTRRLAQLGHVLIWCDEAVVVDHVPAARATRDWVVARARRTGNSDVVVGLRLAQDGRARLTYRTRSLLRALARLVGGAGQRLAGRVTGSMTLQARGAKAVSRGRGMLMGAAGRAVSEYDRGTIERTLRVLASFPEPGPTTNPYIAQLASALDAQAGVDLLRFSWRRALLGRYDVVHLHWPEILVGGPAGTKRTVRQLLFAALLLRWRVGRTAVVRTVHNTTPHEGLERPQRLLLSAVDRLTTARITLNPTGAGGERTTLIPHGHYVDWYRSVPVPDAEPGRIVFAGLVRPYKNVPGLMAALGEVDSTDLRLHVVGRPADDALADELRRLAANDPRISLDLRFVDDAELAHEIGRATLVALPYREMHNSGAVLLALSLGRPVLVPDNEVNRLLAAEVGAEWVQRYEGRLRGTDLVRALAAAQSRPADARPDLSARSWDAAGRQHLAVYRAAVAARRGRR